MHILWLFVAFAVGVGLGIATGEAQAKEEQRRKEQYEENLKNTLRTIADKVKEDEDAE